MPYTYVCVTSSRSHSSCVVTSREGLRSFLTLCSGPVCSHSLGIATSRKCLSSLRERFARWLITHHTRVHVSGSPPMLPAMPVPPAGFSSWGDVLVSLSPSFMFSFLFEGKRTHTHAYPLKEFILFYFLVSVNEHFTSKLRFFR